MASRTRALASSGSARFWFGAFCAAVMPTSIGYQNIAAMVARHEPIARHAQAHLIASPFGTIEPATFSYGVQPIGTVIPRPPAIIRVNFDPRSLDTAGWSIDRPVDVVDEEPTIQATYPTVNRVRKGDRLPSSVGAPATADPKHLPQLQPIDAAPAVLPSRHSAPPAVPALAPSTHAGLPGLVSPVARSDRAAPGSIAAGEPHLVAAAPASGARRTDDADLAGLPAELPAAGQIGASDEAPSALEAVAFTDDGGAERRTQVYFGSAMLAAPSGLQRWAPGAEPVIAAPAFAAADGGIVIGKDESRVESPAQRLGLTGKSRAKAEKCLADAVYFEARGEPLRGQEAVAQVVMNRVFSGYYPSDVCGVVYQNASHYLACQFTFACEHKDLSRIDEPDMWEQAKRIAKDTLAGKIWLPDIGHATHYHAYWVHPSWVHEMTKLDKLGVHTFYRPRAWGSGDDEPVWGTPPDTSKADPKPDSGAKGPQAQATPARTPAAATSEPTAKL